MSAADNLPNWSGAGVLVTGGAAGIGLSLGRAAARRGAKVVLSDIEEDVAEKAAAGLREEGLDASSLRCDVTNPDEVAACIEETVARLGTLNLLCANAGVGASNPITGMSLAEFNWIMQVNLFGVVHAVHAAVPALRSAAAA